MTATFNRPVAGRLVVMLDNGDSWDATPDDLMKFRLADPYEGYRRFNNKLVEVMANAGLLGGGDDATDLALNPMRYFVELSIMYSNNELLDHPEHDMWKDLVHMEKALREAGFEHSA